MHIKTLIEVDYDKHDVEAHVIIDKIRELIGDGI